MSPRRPLTVLEIFDRFEQERLDLEALHRQREADRSAGIVQRTDHGFGGEIAAIYARRAAHRPKSSQSKT